MIDQSKSIFITTENHHAGETFMLVPLLFSLAPQCSSVFFILESTRFVIFSADHHQPPVSWHVLLMLKTLQLYTYGVTFK